MIQHIHTLALGLIVFTGAANAFAIENTLLNARKEAWDTALQSMEFRFPENCSGLLTSLRMFDGDARVHIILDPKSKFTLDFTFEHDGKSIVKIRGHDQSAFLGYGSSLYFAKYPPDSSGCTVVAFDLGTGMKVWETQLKQERPRAHSAYRNLVVMRLSNANEAQGEHSQTAIIVKGMESFTDYVEVLDRQTGISLAFKSYRIGFGQPPGSGGGFDMRGRHENAKGYGGPGGLESQ